MYRFKYFVMAMALVVSGLVALQAPVQAAGGAAAIKAMAKQFSVSPDMLQKFSKMGLSNADLGNGLQLAKSIVSKGDLNISDAAEKVFSLKGEGKDWTQIAKDFDVDLPDFSEDGAVNKLKKLTTE